MKRDIHPEYVETQVSCTCGASFTTRSTISSGAIRAEVCSECHPFYTGKQKILDTGGRVARFEARFGKAAGCQEVASPTAPVLGAPRARGEPGPALCGPPPLPQLTAVPRSPRCSRRSRNSIGEHADLEKKLADPSVHADQANARKLNKRYAELTPIVATYRSWKQTGDDIETAREFAADDPDFAAEVKELEKQREELTEKLRLLLVPRDPSDDKDVILEIKAGAGGDESALFAGDLLRMYLRYAERVGWKTEIIDSTESELGGYKDVQVAVKTKGGNGATEPGQGVWARLKYEGGVHRVQRVPSTESQGRIHTSAAGVLVTPEAEEVDVEIHAERPPHRRLPLLGPRRPVRQHHRLRRAHHAHSHRSRRLLPEREEPAAEQGAGDAYPALQAARRGAGGGGAGGLRRPPQPGPYRRPLREDPYVQLPGEPHLGPPRRLQGVQLGPGPRR